MTTAEERKFIRLWHEGATYRQIAAALKCSISSVAAWAIPLISEGQIEARSPQQRALAQQAGGTGEGVSMQTPQVPQLTPRVSRRVSQQVSNPVPVEVLPSLSAPSASPEMTPVLQEILQELRTLTRGLAGRVSDPTPGVSDRVSERVSLGVSIGPREKTERWNLHLPIDLITKTKEKAHVLGMHPSELVAEILRRWLMEEA